jgi:hypothetical protein
MLKKNLFKYIFLLIISSMVIFNGGNNNLYIQFNFLLISTFFLLIIKEKNYLTFIKSLIKKNNISIVFYFLFILFLLFQTLPLPIEWLKFFSYEKYYYLNSIEFNENFHSISLSPTDSYFNMLNYLSLFLSLIIFKSLFSKKRNILKFYFFLTLIGAFAASIAIYLYLIGNPEFWIIKNPLKKSATGFFISRTIFSCFLVLCFFSGIEYFKKIDIYINNSHNNFFNKIYVRIFLLLITIGIITSFSRLGNFLFISFILFYLLREFYLNDKKDKIFLFTLSFIFLFDVLILGFYFGSEKLFQRYSFLQNEIINYLPSITSENMHRGDLVKFALKELNKYIFFGYGSGGFEHLFKAKFETQFNFYASHVHSDLIEFLGEFGLVGSSLILISIIFVCKNNNFFSFKNFVLLYLLFFILIFDFSFHSPIIQLLFILLFSVNYEEKKIYKSF